MDSFLKSYVEKYDKWIKKDLIDVSSKVIPVKESVEGQQHVIPSHQAREIIDSSDLIALAKCTCRRRYKNCDKPLEVCFILNQTAEKWIEKGKARQINSLEAFEILNRTNHHGLVHLSLYMPDHELFALCSCCPCCCHDLQLLLKYDKTHFTTKSDYIAVDDPAACSICGECVKRCPFDARVLSDELVFDPDNCYGCGLCVTTCPESAIQMIQV